MYRTKEDFTRLVTERPFVAAIAYARAGTNVSQMFYYNVVAFNRLNEKKKKKIGCTNFQTNTLGEHGVNGGLPSNWKSCG